jgi:hypothetical protein
MEKRQGVAILVAAFGLVAPTAGQFLDGFPLAIFFCAVVTIEISFFVNSLTGAVMAYHLLPTTAGRSALGLQRGSLTGTNDERRAL